MARQAQRDRAREEDLPGLEPGERRLDGPGGTEAVEAGVAVAGGDEALEGEVVVGAVDDPRPDRPSPPRLLELHLGAPAPVPGDEVDAVEQVEARLGSPGDLAVSP